MNYLRLFNFCLVLAIGTVALFIFWTPLASDETMPTFVSPPEESLLKNPFSQAEESYELVGGWMALKNTTPQILLPDLREELLFLGKNQRPDATEDRYYLAFKKNPIHQSAELHKPLYIKYLGAKSGAKSYGFSPGNSITPLWLQIEAHTKDSLTLELFIENGIDAPITSPEEHHSFTLYVQEEDKRNNAWEVGGQRVDSTLLFRHGARFVGKDLFFQMHGGKEFELTSTRERIDFVSTEKLYCCFVKERDFLIYKDGKWVAVEGDQSQNYPLLFIKNINDKGMQLELWDESGRHKMALALIRSKPMEMLPDMTQEFKIVGAKTWVECIVECRSQRMVLREGDWLLLTKDGWKKLSTEQEVDDYVEQKLIGPLFVLDKIAKKNGRTELVGHIFNSFRTSCENVELVAQENPVLELEP